MRQNSSQAAAAAVAGASTDEVIAERQNTHGDYGEMSRVQVGLVDVLTSSPGWPSLRPPIKVFLLSTAQKLSRIVSGNAGEPDHYRDIGGYARLAEKSLPTPETTDGRAESAAQGGVGPVAGRSKFADQSYVESTLVAGGVEISPEGIAVRSADGRVIFDAQRPRSEIGILPAVTEIVVGLSHRIRGYCRDVEDSDDLARLAERACRDAESLLTGLLNRRQQRITRLAEEKIGLEAMVAKLEEEGRTLRASLDKATFSLSAEGSEYKNIKAKSEELLSLYSAAEKERARMSLELEESRERVRLQQRVIDCLAAR